MNQEAQPAYSQREMEEEGVSFSIYACVDAKAKTPPMVVAETLQQLGIGVKITEVGKNIDGEDQPEYLRGFREIWVSKEGMRIVEKVRELERYQQSLVNGQVDWIQAKVKRLVLKARSESTSEALPV